MVEQVFVCMAVSKRTCSTLSACQVFISPKHQQSDRIQVEVTYLSK